MAPKLLSGLTCMKFVFYICRGPTPICFNIIAYVIEIRTDYFLMEIKNHYLGDVSHKYCPTTYRPLYFREICEFSSFGDGMLRPSPNHGTQRLPNDDDDDDITDNNSKLHVAIDIEATRTPHDFIFIYNV